MSDKKYEVLDGPEYTKEIDGISVYRIRALKDFTLTDGTEVKAGDLGGFVSHQKTLSHYDSCWISDNAAVITTDDCPLMVRGDCIISENAVVFDTSVSGNAIISGSIKVKGNILSSIEDNVTLSGDNEIDVSDLNIIHYYHYSGGEFDKSDPYITDATGYGDFEA